MELNPSEKELLHMALENLNKANGVVQFLSDYFRVKYHLTPDNQITPEGEIVSLSDLREKEKQNGTSEIGSLQGIGIVPTQG